MTIRTRRAEDLASRTSLGLGGPAGELIEATTVDDLVELVSSAEDAGRSLLVLGGGSNVVVADGGVPGPVVVPTIRGFEILSEVDEVVVVAGAGELLDDVVAETVDRNLAGLECLSGIPGTVGATPIQNVGAYGVEVGEQIEFVEVLDRETLKIDHRPPSWCRLGYRTSRFREEPDRWIVTKVGFRLRPGGAPALRYGELERVFGSASSPPDLPAVRQAVLELRRSKGMVIEDGAPRSAGSFFVNPIVDGSILRAVEHSLGDLDLPRFDAGNGRFKIPAAILIEAVGFQRGFRRGPVGISPHHALALIHHGGGSARELIRLASDIREAVEDRFGIRLRPEPVFWGFGDGDPLGEAG